MARPRKDKQIDISTLAIVEAIRLLDSRDAAAITLADVAAAVGCRAPALYAYFANRDALLRAVHDAGFRMMLQDKLAVAVRNADDPFQRLHDGGLAYVRFAIERPGLYRLMFAPPPGTGLSGSPFDSDPGAQCLAVLQRGIAACQADGYLADEDVEQMAFVLWSSVHGAVSLVLRGGASAGRGTDPVAAASAVVDVLMSFIRSTRREAPANHQNV